MMMMMRSRRILPGFPLGMKEEGKKMTMKAITFNNQNKTTDWYHTLE
jgi:hypothetical protein